MEGKNSKDLEADILEYIKQLDATVGSATHVNEVIYALQPLASKLFNIQKQPGYIVQDNATQAGWIQRWKDIAHEAFRHSFYSGISFPTLSKVLLFEVASNWLACFPLSARVSVFDKFFLYAPASEALQALMLGLPHDHSKSSHEEIDVQAVCSNAERILVLCFVENDGIKRMALDFSTLSKFKTQQENNEGITNMEISSMAQLVASIPDKVRLEAPRVLSAHRLFKQVTAQLLSAAEERYKQMSENGISNIVMGDGTFTFIGETFSRICRRGHADIVASEMVPTLLQHVRRCINSEDVMHGSTELVETRCGLTFWQAITTAIKDSHAMERWTEALLQEMAVLNLDDKEAYWMIWTLFDKTFMNQASIRALFTERFLLWKVFPISCLRWILQFSVFRSSPASKEHSQEDTSKIQLNVVRHLVEIWAKRDFIQSTSMEQQSYITAAIGLSLQKMTKEELESSGELLHSLLQGVSCRLESPISPVRKMASCVALVFSQVIDAKNPLFLDDENCTEEILDWEFGVAVARKKRANISADPPVGEDNNANVSILEYQNTGDHNGNGNEKITGLSEDNMGTTSLKVKSNRRKFNELKVDDPDEVIDLATLNGQDLTDEDDNESVESENESESSLQPYDMSDDESDLKREKLPSHLSECLASLRKADDPDAVEGALEVIGKLVRAVPDELSIVAVDLVRALVHVRCSDVTIEGEEESAEEKRHCSLVALLVSCPLRSVEVITKELYSPNVDVSQRLLILDVMADAAQELSNSRDLKRENCRERGSLSSITELATESAHTTDWDGLSMAGVICTAAHGSSLWGKGGGIHEYVVGIRMVLPALADDGYAKIIHLTEKDEALKAARVSLGVLGAISQVKFAVEKMFKRSVTLELKDDSDLENSFAEFAKSHEFGLMNWYPSSFQVVYSRQDRVAIDIPGNGKVAPIAFEPATVKSVVESRAIEELNNAKINASHLCKSVRTQVEQGVKTGNRYLNDGQIFRGFPVVGYNHLLQSASGCQIDPRTEENNLCPWKGKELKSNDTICAWDTEVKGNFYHHTSIAIPLSRITEAIRDLKQLRDMDPSALCTFGSYLGVELRYFKKSTNYLSHKEDSVEIEFMYFRYREQGRPRWNGHVIDEIEQMLLEKYGGVPHWGKNRVYTFEGAAKRTVNLGKFLEVKKQLDPKGHFSSGWSDGVLGIGKSVQIWRDGCALDGLCVCKEDRHCAPDKGFVCRAGKIWKNASVCIQV